MNRLAEYVMRGRKQAIIITLFLAVNALLLPGILKLLVAATGMGVIALVTLRKGVTEGLHLLLWFILPSAVMAIVLQQPVILFYNAALIGGSLIWLLAAVLRYSTSWNLVVGLTTVLGLIGVTLFHIIVPDVMQLWGPPLTETYQQLNEALQMKLSAADIQGLVANGVKMLAGAQAALTAAAVLGVLAVARGAQAKLYNPGGLRHELHNFHADWVSLLSFVIAAVAAFAGVTIAFDLLPIVSLPFALAGLSLVHHVVNTRRRTGLWLFSFYSLLVVFFPYVMSILVVSAVADTYFNFRARLRLQH